MSEERQAHEKKRQALRDQQLEKLKVLHAELLKLNPGYKLVKDAIQYGFTHGIKLTNGKTGNSEEVATLFIDEHYNGWYSEWKLPEKFYLRITAGWSKHFNRTWTFDTKDIVKKVHEKMTTFLQEIDQDQADRNKRERETKVAVQKAKEAFPDADHYGTSSDGHQTIFITLKLDDDKFGNSQDISYDTIEDTVKVHKTGRISRRAFAKILGILQEENDHAKTEETSNS